MYSALHTVYTLVGMDPEPPWTFVCDDLNTHKSEALVRFVAETCVPDMELGKKGKNGILKNMESRSDFLHAPTRYALSMLQSIVRR